VLATAQQPTVWRFKPAHRRPGNQLTWLQSWIVTRKKRNTVVVAARRSGKTVGARARVLLACLDDRPGDVGYMAPTLGQAKRLLWRPLLRDLRDPAAAAFLEGKPNSGELSVEFKTGTRLYLYSAEACERVRGDGFKEFITDETDDPRFTDDVFDEAIYPALSDNEGALVQLGTPKGRGRLFHEYRKGLVGTAQHDPEYESIQVSAMDAGIISMAEIERARRTRPRRAFEQEYLATFNAPIGLVYDEWNEERHVISAEDIPREFDEVIVGVDWGVAKRGAMIVLGLDRVWVPPSDEYDGCEMVRVTAIEEHSEAGLPYNEHGWWKIAQSIQRAYHPTYWYCDPAGGSADATSAKAEGYLSQLAGALQGIGRARVMPADNRVGPGIAAVQSLMHFDDVLLERPRFRVSRACPWLIKELGNYKYEAARGAEDDFQETPLKKDDHCADALRYACHTHLFSKRRPSGRNDAHHEDRGG